jgi:hypothetical protein
MTYVVYTLGIDSTGKDERNPRSWQYFTDFLTNHRGLVIVDLRFPRNRQQESNPWNGLRMDRYFHAERDYSYVVLGHLLTALHGIESESEKKFPGMHTTLAITRLIAILRQGKDLLCFCDDGKYEGSVRERVATLIGEQLPDSTHQELNYEQATPDDDAIGLNEAVERLWTQFRALAALSPDGRLLSSWPPTDTAHLWPSGASWPAGTASDIILSELAAQHSKGSDWLRHFFDLLPPYQRKGGGLHPTAPPVPPGLRPRAGVESGCGRITCADCYEIDTMPILERLTESAALVAVIASFAHLLQIAEIARASEQGSLGAALPAWPEYLAGAREVFASLLGSLATALPDAALDPFLGAGSHPIERKSFPAKHAEFHRDQEIP